MIRADKLKKLYDEGVNISSYLRKNMMLESNTPEVIEISYDLQAGSYILDMQDENWLSFMELYTKEISKEILNLCEPLSIMEAGVGEATTLSALLKNLDLNVESYGFDISWSRASYAKEWLKENDVNNSTLITTGDLLNIPFCDNSIDVVYTSHSIEPNGGKEEPILKELYRVANKYIVLLEPAYEFATDEVKERMDSHGYCKNLKNIALSLGFNVIKHELFSHSANPLNPTSILIIEKNSKILSKDIEKFACPRYKSPLKRIDETYFSEESLHVYPILNDIPCLRIENSILATKYEDLNCK